VRRSEPVAAPLQHLVYYAEEKAQYPTLLALHGRGADAYDLLPLIEAMQLHDLLVVAPRAPLLFEVSVAYKEYPMGHEVREEALRDLTSWLQRTIA
jgi:predicted esterase